MQFRNKINFYSRSLGLIEKKICWENSTFKKSIEREKRAVNFSVTPKMENLFLFFFFGVNFFFEMFWFFLKLMKERL